MKRNAERKQKSGGKVNGVAEYRAIKAENTYKRRLLRLCELQHALRQYAKRGETLPDPLQIMRLG